MSEILTILALVASIFMGISIGASTVASAFGPVNSARSANVLRSAFLAGVFALLGALLQGGNVAETVGSGIMQGEMQIIQAGSILLIAAALVIISVMGDYPMPTAFTVIGAVIGSALGFGNSVLWGSVGRIIGYWVLIPFLAVALGYGISKILRKYVSKESSQKKNQDSTFGFRLLCFLFCWSISCRSCSWSSRHSWILNYISTVYGRSFNLDRYMALLTENYTCNII